MISMIKADSNNRILFPQARDVLGVTSMVVGAALQRAHVDMVRHFIINQSETICHSEILFYPH